MRNIVARISITGLILLVLTSQAAWGRARFETQIKKVIVVDSNDVPVSGARVYQGECLVWDNRTQTLRLKDDTPWQRTDAQGVFSFEFVRQGVGRHYFVADAFFVRMGCLYIPRQDETETYILHLEKPARIKGVIRSADTTFPDMLVKLDCRTPKALFPLLSTDYLLESPMHEVAFDLRCPAGCDLNLRIESKAAGIKEHQHIPALKPDQVLDMGVIELRSSSGSKAAGKLAPELEVAEWVRGEPVTLTELKGNVVLLDFWGLWCDACRNGWPKLVELHKKYARDGLVIIAIHDASENKASLLKRGRQLVDLANTPFRVAVDAAPREGERLMLEGKGRTIDAYGVNSFPTLVLVDRDGQVHTLTGGEQQFYSLFYGRPMPKPTTLVGRLMMANRLLVASIAAVLGLILLLGLVFGILRLHKSTNSS